MADKTRAVGSTGAWDGQVTLDPNAWTIGPIINGVNYSERMPLHPSSPWQFTFPVGSGGPDYIYTPAAGGLTGFMHVRLEFDISDGDGPFHPTDSGGPGVVRLYIESQYNDWVSANGRFWSEATQLSAGHHVMDIALDPAHWTNVYGQHDAAGFAAALAAPANVGFTFGGSFNHGVWSEDAAIFHLIDYDFLDTAVPTDAADYLDETNGSDTVAALGGNDTVLGYDAADLLFGNAGADLLVGGNQADIMVGGLDDDILLGNQDADILLGNEGADVIVGGQGDDIAVGGKDGDTLAGNEGNDTLCGNEGDDSVIGGDGSDLFLLSGARADYVIQHVQGGWSITGLDGHDFVSDDVETVRFTGSGEQL